MKQAWSNIRQFVPLPTCSPCCGLFSDGFCGALLIPSCAAVSEVAGVLTTECVETE